MSRPLKSGNPDDWALPYGRALADSSSSQTNLLAYLTNNDFNISRTTIGQILRHNNWPVNCNRDKGRKLMIEFAIANGLAMAENVHELFITTDSTPVNQQYTFETLEHKMLNPQALRHFGLLKDPFSKNAVRTIEDVLLTHTFRMYIETMMMAARNKEFLLAWAEVGTGKTIAKKYFYHRMAKEHPEITIVEPRSVARVTLDQQHIAGALLRELALDLGLANTTESRDEAIERELEARKQDGQQYIVLIDEGHDLSANVFSLLKRWGEIGRGFEPLLGVIVIGQPELKAKINKPDVREFTQRATTTSLAPLGDEIASYIKHKLTRAGGNADFIDPNAYDAIQQFLTASEELGNNRGRQTIDITYPLNVNRYMTTLMAKAYELGEKRITKELIEMTRRIEQ